MAKRRNTAIFSLLSIAFHNARKNMVNLSPNWVELFKSFLRGLEMKDFTAKIAVVRDIPKSFAQALKRHSPETPIDVRLAEDQHQSYVRAMRTMVPTVIQLPSDEGLPDCCFVEDTAVIVGRIAAINRLGAPERRGEEKPMREALQRAGLETIDLTGPATADGGDVLFTGRHLFVGLSERTNEAGFRQLKEIFGSVCSVCPVPVSGVLHLKSMMSAFDPETVIVSDDEAGRTALDFMRKEYALGRSYSIISVPHSVAANIISVNGKILIQDGFPQSETILKDLALKKNKEVITVKMSELIKADGALTCCSVLADP
jgi:dimethylargininase